MSKLLAWVVMVLLAVGLGACGGSGDDDSSDAAYGSSAGYTSLPGTGGTGATSGKGGGGTNASGGSGAGPITIAPAPSGAGGGGGSGGSAGTGTGGTAAGTAGAGATAGTSGDQFDAPGTNPFVETEHDPLSTFGADVDTASYDIFRRDIEDGRLPDPDGVRLEEFVNAFDYDYPAPDTDDEVPFSISLAAGPGLYESGTMLLRVGIQGKLAPEERGQANLVFLVDVSGSMASADKLPFVQLMLRETLEVLESTDLVSIVTYAGNTSVALEPTPVSEKSAILAVIDGLKAGGGTAGGAGMMLAYEQAESAYIEGGINHIVMCTDGDFNVGISTEQGILDLVTEKRATGVTLTTLGFGTGNLNDSMMEKVSNAGNGMYSVISSEDQAIAYVNDRLLSTMLHVAKDMKLQVEFNPELVAAYRLLGYEDRDIADQDFRDDAVDAGEVGVGLRVTAIYELVPVGVDVPEAEGAPALLSGEAYTQEREVADGDWVLVKIRYKEPGASETDDAYEVSASLAEGDELASYNDFDTDFRWAAAVAALAEVLKESPYAHPELLEGISTILHAEAGTDPARSELVSLFELARPMIEERDAP